MTDSMLTLIIVAVAAVAVLIILWLLFGRRRSRHLREDFGPEYEHVLEERGDRREAEKELAGRRKRVEKMDLRALNQGQRQRFADEWQSVQTRFVDKPSDAVSDAQNLVEDVMEARGYPVGDIRSQEADVSVENPDVVSHFRRAREIADRNRDGKASTEDLRQAMQHYREMFDALLSGGGAEAVPETSTR